MPYFENENANISVPDYIKNLENEDLINQAFTLLANVQSGAISKESLSVKAAYLYERNGEPSFDGVFDARNRSYSSKNDPLVLEFTLVLNDYERSDDEVAFIETVNELKNQALIAGAEERLRNADALIKNAEAQIEADKAELARLKANRD